MCFAPAIAIMILISFVKLDSINTSHKFDSINTSNLKLQHRNIVISNLVKTTTLKANIIKKIIYWTPFDHDKTYGFGLGNMPFRRAKCQVYNCETTLNKGEYNRSDAIIVHPRNLRHLSDLPSYRSQSQTWVYFLMESPVFQGVNNKVYNGLFNLTMTYRFDSDIFIPYGYFINIISPSSGGKIITKSTSTRKRLTLVTWLVSHRGQMHSNRENYVNELKKYTEVDVYGKGGRRCGGHNTCIQQIIQYKFYLAFENSVCRDYITEKAWYPLTLDVVPIVLGGGNYSKMLPPNSFIDINNFSSPRQLADYLHMLDQNDSLYHMYFEWKKKYVVKSFREKSNVMLLPDGNESVKHYDSPWCHLCRHLHSKTKNKVYTHLDRLWSVEKDCGKPSKEF